MARESVRPTRQQARERDLPPGELDCQLARIKTPRFFFGGASFLRLDFQIGDFLEAAKVPLLAGGRSFEPEFHDVFGLFFG